MATVNYEAEVAVLGAVLVDGTLFKELELREEHFAHIHHLRIFQAMKKVADKGEMIDIVTVTTYLEKDIYEIGGTTYLLKMAESIATTANIKQHERLIFEAYRTRKAQELALRYSENPSDEAIDNLIKGLQTCAEDGLEKQGKSTYDYLVELSEDMYSGQGPAGYMSSYRELDYLTGGWQPGDLIIVAARPSVGKTAFALNLAMNHCKNGGSSLIFSLEMGSLQLLKRMVSNLGQIDAQKWRRTNFSSDDFNQAAEAVGTLSKWDLHLMDKVRTLSDIRHSIRRALHDDPAGKPLVIIDYLQLISPSNSKERHDISIGEITRELKLLAVELNIPIILLSQLTRGVETRQNKRPLMSDLRGSGNIEQDADVIIFLYREDYYNKEAEKEQEDKVEIIISKQRNGPTGVVELGFVKEFGEFV